MSYPPCSKERDDPYEIEFSNSIRCSPEANIEAYPCEGEGNNDGRKHRLDGADPAWIAIKVSSQQPKQRLGSW